MSSGDEYSEVTEIDASMSLFVWDDDATGSGGNGNFVRATKDALDAEITNNSAVAANTAKTGITSAQADAIVLNTAKVSYPGDELTSDELAAVNGAATPSSSNVFATMDDVSSLGSGDLLSTNNLSDVASVSASRANLGVDAAGTDNSTNVTLTGTPDYITISGQTITRNQIDLTADVTGILPDANIPSTIARDSEVPVSGVDFDPVGTDNSTPELSTDQLAAVNDSASPSASNVFATMADVSSAGSGISIVATDPSSPSTDDIWVNTTDGQLKVKTSTGTFIFDALDYVAD